MALSLALLVMAFIFIACCESFVAHGAVACVARDGIASSSFHAVSRLWLMVLSPALLIMAFIFIACAVELSCFLRPHTLAQCGAATPGSCFTSFQPFIGARA